VVVRGPGGLDANHLPFELDPTVGAQGVLRAHVARGNSLWTDVADGDEALVIFRAADGYISPNWYPSKLETHRHVPTWNYRVVHVHGRVHIRDDETFVRGVVARLTHVHETRTDPERRWAMSDAPRDFIAEMLKAIVGVEIEITRMVGKMKVSQNREARDRDGAAEGAAAHGNQAMADAIRGPSRKD
jgi:transcriptional regulator